MPRYCAYITALILWPHISIYCKGGEGDESAHICTSRQTKGNSATDAMEQIVDPSTMNLCSVCQRLGPAALRRAPSHHSPLDRRQYIPPKSPVYTKHHSSYLALATAAEEGCDLCSLTRESVLSAYVDEHKCPRREAEVPFLEAARGHKPCCLIQTGGMGPDLAKSVTFQVPNKLGTSSGHSETEGEWTSVRLELQNLPTGKCHTAATLQLVSRYGPYTIESHSQNK